MGRKLVAPLSALGLADLRLGAELRDGRALQAFDDDHRLGFAVPFAALQG
jgi:hypothetical protein